ADDGGSSGRLRASVPGLPAPGDVRRCLGALADPDVALGQVLEHRIEAGEDAGHALGNLVIVGLAQDLGSFGAAVDEVARQVGAVGRVLPATSVAVDLEAEVADAGEGPGTVRGQVAVAGSRSIDTVHLVPADAPSPPEVGEAILAAEQVVLGPGSLFTSVLAAAVVPAVRSALAETSARRVLVANLRPQEPETAGLAVADEVAALARHGIEVDDVLVDPLRTDDTGEGATCCPVADERGLVHDPERLAAALSRLVTG
ncbi:MAG: YvcK family protein, partial [Acidimicrobiales bacterium]|nr:YvcK family protein [Acidimicrobiales bacterium]